MVSDFKEQLVSLYKQGFGESDAYTDFFFKKRYSEENAVAVFDGGRVVSALHLIPQKIMIDNKPQKAGFISSAATLPELRGQGVFFRTMEAAYEMLRRRGAEYCVLYPFKHEYYRRHGFIEYTYVYRRVCGANVPARPQNYRIKRYGHGDKLFIKELNAIYGRMCAGFEGYIIRDEKEMLFRAGEAAADGGEVLIIEAGAARGYVLMSGGNIEECCFTDFTGGGSEGFLIDSVKELYGAEYFMPVNLPLKKAAECPGARPFGMIKKLGCTPEETFGFFKDKNCILLDQY